MYVRGGSTLCDPEPSLRLIGEVAKTAQFDGNHDRDYLKANKCAGFFGTITGRKHFAYTNKLGGGLKADKVGVANCYCHYGTKTVEAYRFSLFVFDTEANKVHEIRLAGGNKKYNRPNRPQELVHEIDIG